MEHEDSQAGRKAGRKEGRKAGRQGRQGCFFMSRVAGLVKSTGEAGEGKHEYLRVTSTSQISTWALKHNTILKCDVIRGRWRGGEENEDVGDKNRKAEQGVAREQQR